ncbi:MAG: hypothetical protein M3134_11675 [Actinomycetota bacterium]|nr:hypothetical protein [Actinomycetota bacterium]
MTLTVDFNMHAGDGLVLALLENDEQRGVRLGETVVAQDFEGSRCKATVAKVVEGPLPSRISCSSPAPPSSPPTLLTCARPSPARREAPEGASDEGAPRS